MRLITIKENLQASRSIFMNKIKFEELPLSAEMQRAIADMGFEEASPIQTEAIPVILEGRGAMPGYRGQITEQEAEELAAYTQNIK